MITTDDRIITAVHVDKGAYVDGKVFDDVLELTKRSGVAIDEVYGDKAYFRKRILDTIKEIGAEAYLPLSEMAYKIDEYIYSYNKDSDEWLCAQGNKTLRKVYKKKKHGRETYKYYFERQKGRNCPLGDICIKSAGTVGRILEIS